MQMNFWKPNRDGNGHAALFNYGGEDCAYLSMMPQKGERNFDSEKKINVKLNVTDFGELLSVLTGMQDSAGGVKDEKPAGLFHKNQSGHSVIKLYRSDKRPGYVLAVSKKYNDVMSNAFIGLTLGEAESLRVFLEMTMSGVITFSGQDNRGNQSRDTQSQNTESSSNETETEAVPAMDDIPF